MNYVFLIDVSYEAIVSGMVSSACSGILQTLYGAEGESEGSGHWPSASKVSVITFDRVLHFYDISVSPNTIDPVGAFGD
jgi:protein transport protein SEC24